MRKIIEIKNSKVNELKKLAIDNNKSFKKYLEDLIENHYEANNTTELAERMFIDGQPGRSIIYYFDDTFKAIKFKKFPYGEKFETFKQFIQYASDVLKQQAELITKYENTDFSKKHIPTQEEIEEYNKDVAELEKRWPGLIEDLEKKYLNESKCK